MNKKRKPIATLRRELLHELLYSGSGIEKEPSRTELTKDAKYARGLINAAIEFKTAYSDILGSHDDKWRSHVRQTVSDARLMKRNRKVTENINELFRKYESDRDDNYGSWLENPLDTGLEAMISPLQMIDVMISTQDSDAGDVLTITQYRTFKTKLRLIASNESTSIIGMLERAYSPIFAYGQRLTTAHIALVSFDEIAEHGFEGIRERFQQLADRYVNDNVAQPMKNLELYAESDPEKHDPTQLRTYANLENISLLDKTGRIKVLDNEPLRQACMTAERQAGEYMLAVERKAYPHAVIQSDEQAESLVPSG